MMAKLIHKNKTILSDVKVMTNIWRISLGLMFARKKTVDRGACLVMPTKQDVKYGSAVTMFFCFFKYDVLFVNSDFKVVDRKVLKPWTMSYVPKKPSKYIFESTSGKFANIKIGDEIKLVNKS